MTTEFPLTVNYAPGPAEEIPQDIDSLFRDGGLTPRTVFESNTWHGLGAGPTGDIAQWLTISLDWVGLAKVAIGISLGAALKRAGEDAWEGVKKAVARIAKRRSPQGPLQVSIRIPWTDTRPATAGVFLFVRFDNDLIDLEDALNALDHLSLDSGPGCYNWNLEARRWERA